MKTALITGASSGIGETFAQELAARNTNLVLVARSEDKLHKLANQLQNQYKIQTDVIVQDLTAPAAAKTLFETVTQKQLIIDLLVNNAGFGDYGAFAQRPLEKQVNMIQLNITALVELTHLFLPGMQQRQSGAIINVSSENIGRIKKTKIKDIGFDFSSDNTVRPSTSLPIIIS